MIYCDMFRHDDAYINVRVPHDRLPGVIYGLEMIPGYYINGRFECITEYYNGLKITVLTQPLIYTDILMIRDIDAHKNSIDEYYINYMDNLMPFNNVYNIYRRCVCACIDKY